MMPIVHLTTGEFWLIVIVVIGGLLLWRNAVKEKRGLAEHKAREARERAARAAREDVHRQRIEAGRRQQEERAAAAQALPRAIERLHHVDDAALAAARQALGSKMIETWQQAEKFVAIWMGQAGFKEVRLTPPGADEGIDVEAEGFIAQVKFQAGSIGRPMVQQLYGQAQILARQALFFSKSPYSKGAFESANGRVALFRYTHEGIVTPVNDSARNLAKRFDDRLQGHAFSTIMIAEAMAMRDTPPPEPKPRSNTYRSQSRRRHYGRRRYYRP